MSFPQEAECKRYTSQQSTVIITLTSFAKMLEVQSTLDFLQDLPLYKTERPYVFTCAGEMSLDESHPTLNTVKLHDVPVTLQDIRDAKGYNLSTSGFEKVNHATQVDLNRIQDEEVRREYRTETAKFLKQHLGAEHVYCYNVKVCTVPTHHQLWSLAETHRLARTWFLIRQRQ